MIHFFLLFLDSVKRASEIMNPFPTFKKTLLCIRGKYLTTNHNSIFLIKVFFLCYWKLAKKFQNNYFRIAMWRWYESRNRIDREVEICFFSGYHGP